uniref:Putative reverse transcriptase domain-containing protein n=1 Tax=Tanacetum cinerariifolium TaxID=118510 RepID=A0A6L2M4K5_TANCI|nr:putative reverse transcriptase domain-containing protein [Tanacetum cinerariifolium]
MSLFMRRRSFVLPGNETLIVRGDESHQGNETRLNIISCTKMQKYMLKGCHVILAHVTTKETEDKLEKKRLEDVPIVRDFPKVFPEDLSAVFIDLMNRLCKPYLDKFVILFIDDILIYSKNKEEPEEHIKLILELLKKKELYAKNFKCEFWIPKVQFLRHVIDSQGIDVDPAKIKSIKYWASPKTPTEICQFLGLDDYYRRFIKGFLKIAKSMTKLTQKKVKFDSGDKQEADFQLLKHKLCSAPILALLEGSEDFIVYCDASIKGLGVVLMQREKEDLFTYCNENGILQDSSEPSNDNTNIVNALREPFVVNQDPHKNSSQSPPQINHNCCYGCGDPLEDVFCHQCTCKLCGNDAHYGYNCPPKVLIIPNPKPFNNQIIDELPQNLPSFDPTCYSEDKNSFTYDSKSNLVHDSPNVFNPPSQPPLYSCEFYKNDARYNHYCTPQKEEEKQIEEEQAAKARYWKIPACYDDDDDDYTIAITHKEPDNSLIFTTFSNILFDADYDFSSSDDQSFSDEDIPKKIYSNPLFDEEMIFMKIYPHHFNDESDLQNLCLIMILRSFLLLRRLILFSMSSSRLLYDKSSPRPPEEFISENSDAAFESFSPFPIPVEDSDSLMEEIDLSFTLDDSMPLGIEEDDYDSERGILILEEFLSNDFLSLPENELFYFDIPSSSRPPAKPPDGNSGILNVKMMGDISKHKVPIPRLMFTQSTLVPNQEKSPKILPHLGHEAF